MRLGIALCLAAMAQASALPEDLRRRVIERLTSDIVLSYRDADVEQQLRAITLLRQVLAHIAVAAAASPPDAQPIRRALVPAIEAARVDKQAGGTGLVQKGSLPGVLGMALEGGDSVVVHANLVGIFDALSQQSYLGAYDRSSQAALVVLLRRAFFTATLRSSAERQVPAYTLHVDLFNRRDPRHPAFQPLWRKAAEESLREVAVSANRMAEGIEELRKQRPEIRAWEKRFFESVRQAGENPGAIEAAVAGALVQLELELAPVIASLDPVTRAVTGYLNSRDRVLRAAAHGSVASIEFNTKKQQDRPDLLNHRFIFESDLGTGGKTDFTLNASLTRLRGSQGPFDYQAGAQLAVPLAFNGAYENWLFSAAWSYQGPRILHQAQVKWTIPLKDGIKVPLAVTWSPHRKLHAMVGLTLDLDPLIARLKP